MCEKGSFESKEMVTLAKYCIHDKYSNNQGNGQQCAFMKRASVSQWDMYKTVL